MSDELRKAAQTLRDMLACCEAWEPSVCILGNVRAGDAAKALRAALSEPAEPTQEQIRAEFEAWIKAPPFEREPMRYPQTHATWPGSYREIQTDFAWQAWQAAYAAGRASKEQS